MHRLPGGMRTLRVPALLVVAWVVGLATATAQEGHCPGLPVPAWGAVVTRPACLTRAGTQSTEQVVVAARLTEEDLRPPRLCRRRVHQLGPGAGVCAPGTAILHAIAWGVMNRVRLGQARAALGTKYGAGIRGVVFKPGQFNPAVSVRSRFAPVFLCPTAHPAWAQYWSTAVVAVGQAQHAPEQNPFLLTAWEKRTGLSLVAHFYYPLSVQATPQPPAWAETSARSTTFVRDVTVCGTQLNTTCIWFFRLEKEFSQGHSGRRRQQRHREVNRLTSTRRSPTS